MRSENDAYARATDVEARSYNDACLTTTYGRSQSDRADVDVVSYDDASTTTKLAFTSKRLEESESLNHFSRSPNRLPGSENQVQFR